MDFRLFTDRSMCVVGPTQCGKTHFVLKLLDMRHELFRKKFSKVLWCYGIHNNELLQQIRRKGYETHYGLPNVTDIARNSICILDDLLSESDASTDVTKMFTKAAHHLPCFIIFISQTLFPPGKDSRTRSLNTHYFTIFKNPRDQRQFNTLAQQVAPNRSKVLIELYEEATRSPHGYIFIDFTQECPDKYRYRGDILQIPFMIYQLF